MIPFLGAPIGKGLLIGIGILLLFLAAESGVVLSQAKTIGGLQAEQKIVATELAVNVRDLRQCTDGAEILAEAHHACLEEIRTSKEWGEGATRTIATLTEQVAKGSASVKREREVIYQQPGCSELAKLDLHAACPALADSLRARAAETVSAAPDH